MLISNIQRFLQIVLIFEQYCALCGFLSFIPTVPPSFTKLRLGKWLRKLTEEPFPYKVHNENIVTSLESQGKHYIVVSKNAFYFHSLLVYLIIFRYKISYFIEKFIKRRLMIVHHMPSLEF